MATFYGYSWRLVLFLLHVHGWFGRRAARFAAGPATTLHGWSAWEALSGGLTCSSSSIVLFFALLRTNALRTVRLIVVTLILCTWPHNLCKCVVALTRAERNREKKYAPPGQNMLRRVQQASPHNRDEFTHELFAHRAHISWFKTIFPPDCAT